MDIAKLFCITFLAAFIGVIPPGLINMSVVKTCLERGKKNGILVALGASLVVYVQAMIAIGIATYVLKNESLYQSLYYIGTFVFLGMAFYFFWNAKKQRKIVRYKKQYQQSFLKGMMLSVLNILPIPYFCFVSAAAKHSESMQYSWTAVLWFSLAATLGTFSTLYLYVISFSRIEQKIELVTRYANYIMSAMMLVLAILALSRVVLS